MNLNELVLVILFTMTIVIIVISVNRSWKLVIPYPKKDLEVSRLIQPIVTPLDPGKFNSFLDHLIPNDYCLLDGTMGVVIYSSDDLKKYSKVKYRHKYIFTKDKSLLPFADF